MTLRNTILPGLIVALMWPTLACGGSEVSGDEGEGSTDVVSGDGTVTPPASLGTIFLDCVGGNSETCYEGATACLASDTCTAGLDCMAVCADAVCAAECIAVAAADDQAALQGLSTCAAFGGCLVGPATVCGDGTCDDGEDADGCPDDCAAADTSCFEDNCALGNCMDLPDCSAVIDCMAGCDTSECGTECIALAPPEASALLTDIAACGIEAGCFDAGPVEDVCGDGVCADAETCEGCPDDCGAAPPTSDCCVAHDTGGCSDAVCEQFICEMDQSCCEMWHQGCADTAAQICDQCAATGPCCGDEVCESPEDAVSCAKDCAEDVPEPGSCIADNCGLGDCEGDEACAQVLACMEMCDNVACAELCVLNAPEDLENLPDGTLECGIDAGCFGGTQPPDDCLVDACDTGNCEAFPDCVAALDCIAGCATTQCADACVLATTAAFHAPLYNLVECGVDAGCLVDAAAFCGDGECNGVENYDTCPGDCPPVCGDGLCTDTENAGNCENDCAVECGDGFCTHNEDWGSCPADCPPECGDNICTPPADDVLGETADSCAEDCPAECGDGFCTHNEDYGSCPEECAPECGDGLCTPPGAGILGETAATCEDDCDAVCGDDLCTHNEDWGSCSDDCDPVCGDGFCTASASETAATCVADCPAECGDGICTFGETEGTCPAECEGTTEYYGILIQDDWNGDCLNYNAAGADIASVELLNCPTDNPADCVVVAYLQDAFAQVGTEGCTNGFQNPQQAEGPCGCEIDQWITLQGGWLAGSFGDNPITSGMTVRVYEYGADFGGEVDPYTVSVVTDPACMTSQNFDGCLLDFGPGLNIGEFIAP